MNISTVEHSNIFHISIHYAGSRDTLFFFFLNNTAPPEISTLPQHAALPISTKEKGGRGRAPRFWATSCSPIHRDVKYLIWGSRRAPRAPTRTTDRAPAALAASAMIRG